MRDSPESPTPSDYSNSPQHYIPAYVRDSPEIPTPSENDYSFRDFGPETPEGEEDEVLIPFCHNIQAPDSFEMMETDDEIYIVKVKSEKTK